MKEKQLTINKRLKDVKRSLKASIRYAVYNRQKIHITAPTGTGKTRLAIEIIEEYIKKGYNVIVLEPQIAITSQVKTKLDDKGIKSFVYNSTTWRDLDKWEEENNTQVTIFLSTIDSAFYLFESGKLDPLKTIVIIDESHAFLQKTRSNFDQTVRAIEEAGCPVIGFTATESSWVINYLFNFDSIIRIEATGLRENIINPILVPGGIPEAIAAAIASNKYNKVVIWTETIEFQNRIALAITQVLPDTNIIVLNAETRDDAHKASWDYIMQNDELLPGTNVAIFNSVAQAGININDNDIDYQYLVGQFDPLGFLQYLGRARNYKGEFNFLYHDYGKQLSLFPSAKELNDSITLLEKTLQQFTEENLSLFGIVQGFKDLYTFSADGKLIINKCMVANRIYEKYRKLHGSELLKHLKVFDPHIIIREVLELRGYSSGGPSKKQYRKDNRDKLPKMIKYNALDLKGMIEFYSKSMKHDTAIKIVNESTNNKSDAKKHKVLYVPKTRKKKLIKTIETAKKASVSMQQIISAASNYIFHKKDDRALKAVMQLSGKKIEQLIIAVKFYTYDYTSNPIIKKTLKSFDSKVSECKSADDWKKEIQAFIQIPGSFSIAATIYDCCFVTKRSKFKNDDGESVNGQRLDSVVRTFDDYKKENKMDYI